MGRATGRQHARPVLAAGNADAPPVADAVAVEAVGTDACIHGPGRQAETVEGQGQQQGRHVHVVHVVPAATVVAVALEIVIVQTRPQTGEGHVLVDLPAGRDAGGVITPHLAAGGHAGQCDALQAHAHLDVGIRHHPVQPGVLDFHHRAVGAQGTAGGALAPDLVAHFKDDGTGKAFRGHGVQLQTQALAGLEVVLVALLVTGHAVAAGEGAMLAVIKGHDPLAADLEVDGLGHARGGKQQAGGQEERCDLFHGVSFSVELASICRASSSLRS